MNMYFDLQANVTFEAGDIEDAWMMLAEHCMYMCDNETGKELKANSGKIEITPQE